MQAKEVGIVKNTFKRKHKKLGIKSAVLNMNKVGDTVVRYLWKKG